MQRSYKSKNVQKSNNEIKKEIAALFDKTYEHQIQIKQYETQEEIVLDINTLLAKKFKLHKEVI